MPNIWGFIFLVTDEQFQWQDLEFVFDDSERRDVLTNRNAFCLSDHDSEDKDNGLMVKIGYANQITLIPIAYHDYEDNHEENKLFFSWHKLWKQYDIWLKEIETDEQKYTEN